MNSMTRVAVAVALATALVSCRPATQSPQSANIQFERRVDVADGRARIALRLESVDPATVLINVVCDDGSERTLTVVTGVEAGPVCGVTFSFTELMFDGTEPNGARIEMRWDALDSPATEPTN